MVSENSIKHHYNFLILITLSKCMPAQQRHAQHALEALLPAVAVTSSFWYRILHSRNACRVSVSVSYIDRLSSQVLILQKGG